jgi:hypothetical protein
MFGFGKKKTKREKKREEMENWFNFLKDNDLISIREERKMKGWLKNENYRALYNFVRKQNAMLKKVV